MQVKALFGHLGKTTLAFIVVTGLILAFLVSQVSAQSQTPQILLEADKNQVKTGENLVVNVSLETGEGNMTNSFIASLNYPADQLDFVSIDTSKSPFTMALEAKGGDGQVKIIRGATKGQTGKILIGQITWKAKDTVNASVITVNNDSAIIRSSDNTNILPGSTVQNDTPQINPSVAPSMAPETQPVQKINSFIEAIKKWFSYWFN